MADKQSPITGKRHPDYDANIAKWKKYRYTYDSGDEFRTEYLEKFSTRENTTDYETRKRVTHVPAFAKASVIEIKNSIYNRMCEIRRIGGSPSYQKAMKANVDLTGSTMNAFIGSTVLPELLAIGKIGIFVDVLPNRLNTGTRMDDVGRHPYVYVYKAEQILCWTYDEDHELSALLLLAQVDVVDPTTGLTTTREDEYRLFRRHTDARSPYISLLTYNSKGEMTGNRVYALEKIPFYIAQIKESLLVDVCEYQIGLMNLSSSDMIHGIQSNFPFYVEQRDPRSANIMRMVRYQEGDTTDGTALKAATAAAEEIEVGNVKGRSYAPGLEQPNFINPSSEPMQISLEKQDVMKREIRQLVQLAVTNMDPRRETADSKKLDSRGLEAGLSFIAQELEKTERAISEFWSMYTSDEPAVIRYPEDYSLISDSERLAQVEKLIKTASASPSLSYQKSIMKQVAEVMLAHRVTTEELNKIIKEIDEAKVVIVDPAILQKDVEMQICSADTAAIIRGYGKGEAVKAQNERAVRAAQIVEAQTAAAAEVDNTNGEDSKTFTDSQDRKTEKKESQDKDVNPDLGKKTRGEA